LIVIRQNFIDEIRKALQNSSIGIEIRLSENEAQPKAYKPADIFKVMSEKNPVLLDMKKRFGLEIDY